MKPLLALILVSWGYSNFIFAAETTPAPEGGKSNWEKIRERYRDQRSSLIND